MDLNLYLFIKKPAYQALLFFLLTTVLILILQPKNSDKAWLIAAYLFIFYLVINAGLLWFDNFPWLFLPFHKFYCGLDTTHCIHHAKTSETLQIKGSGESAIAFLLLIYQPALTPGDAGHGLWLSSFRLVLPSFVGSNLVNA